MAGDWPRLPAFQTEEEAEASSPPDWTSRQIETLFDKLPIGKRFDQKSSHPQGRIPVVDQSRDGFVGFHNEAAGIEASTLKPVITFANHTCEMRVMRRSFSVIQNVFPMTGRQGLCDTLFFYYATKGRVHLEEYKGHYPDYRRLWVPLPPLPEQKRIAHILGTLDDKIELNRRMNATLEGISRALFKSWFVDFDPVRQKAAGKQPVGMDAQTAALFPDSFEDSEIGEVPKGWRVQPLDEVADYLNGLALQKFPAGDGPTLPVIKIAQLRKGDATDADRCNDAVPAAYVIEDGDVLFSWSGSLEVVIWCGGRGALNQHLFKVTSQLYPKWFYHLWTLHHLADFRLIAADKATTMGHIQRKHLSAAKVIVPPAGCIDGMTRTMEPLLLQSIRISTESRTLAALRDTLLPKLLSGEIRVPEAEQAVEEAIA